MSNTCTIVCKECKEEYWFGQTSHGKWVMYTQSPFIEFLIKHKGHTLIVMDENSIWPSWYDYESFKQLSYDVGKD